MKLSAQLIVSTVLLYSMNARASNSDCNSPVPWNVDRVKSNLKITNKMSLDEKFNAAADKVKTFTKRPTDEELLDLYALFKQATVGDNNTSKPGMLDLKGKAKWEWWNKQKGKSQDVAKQEYIEFVEKLSASYL